MCAGQLDVRAEVRHRLMNAILRDSYCALRPPRAVRDAHVRRGDSTSSSTPAPARGHAHLDARGPRGAARGCARARGGTAKRFTKTCKEMKRVAIQYAGQLSKPKSASIYVKRNARERCTRGGNRLSGSFRRACARGSPRRARCAVRVPLPPQSACASDVEAASRMAIELCLALPLVLAMLRVECTHL